MNKWTKEETSTIKGGALSGLTGVLFFILSIAFVGIFLPADPVELGDWVTRFPEVQHLRVIENIIYLTAVALIVQIGMIVLGAGMIGSTDIGRPAAVIILVLGVLGLIAAIIQIILPESFAGGGSYFALVIQVLVLGLRLKKISAVSADNIRMVTK